MKKYRFILTIILLIIGSYCYSQIVSFDSEQWEIHAKKSKIETYLGKQALFLQQGFAIVKDVDLTDVTIEYDVAFSNKRGFIGAVWRLKDLDNHEHFYMRSHQSGNPDSVQYTPVFNGSSAWQIYHEDGHAAAIKHSFDTWTHVKLIISGKNAEIYIGDMEKPVLFIHDLKREIQAGKIGITGGIGTSAYFANFTYSTDSNLAFKENIKKMETPEGVVMSWLVSNSFAEKSLKSKYLTDTDKQNLTWTQLDSDYSGLANLAKIQAPKKDKNSVFARIIIISEIEQMKSLKFGFSDRAKVYFNNILIYNGNNTFRSRDYRFLGTIGFFDELHLPLQKGKNKLWIAVSETSGGWGIKAEFENMAGILVK